MSKKILFTLVILGLLAFMSCSQTPKESSSGTAGNAAPAAKEPSSAEPVAKPAPEPPKPLVLAANTPIRVRLMDAVNSAKNRAGDAFQASLDEDLIVDGKVVFPKNSTVQGKVTRAVPSGRLKTPAEIGIMLTEIIPPHGKAVPIETTIVGEKAQSHNKRNAELIGGGAGVGAGTGTAVAYGTGKKDIGYASETALTFRLRSPVSVQP